MNMSIAFADLAKAFDSIDRTLLLKKQKFYGICGQFHKLLQNYLTNRKQVVNISGNFSDKCSIAYGVPQGNILGPLLFNLFIMTCVVIILHRKFVFMPTIRFSFRGATY